MDQRPSTKISIWWPNPSKETQARNILEYFLLKSGLMDKRASVLSSCGLRTVNFVFTIRVKGTVWPHESGTIGKAMKRTSTALGFWFLSFTLEYSKKFWAASCKNEIQPPACLDHGLHRILSSYWLALFYLMKKSAKVLLYFGLDCRMLEFFTHER